MSDELNARTLGAPMDGNEDRSPARLGYGFVEPRYLPPAADEYYLRWEHSTGTTRQRALTASEISLLTANGSQSDDWSMIQVADGFDATLVQRCRFYGLVRLGALACGIREFDGLRLPIGLYDSTIISCDIGDDVAIHQVRYLAHYRIAAQVLLFNIGRMWTSDTAKFGNGVIKEGEAEAARRVLHLGNENGGRAVWPFEGMLPADAWLWAKFRDDPALLRRLEELVIRRCDQRRGYYGAVGRQAVICDCHSIKDVRVGAAARIQGAERLENLTIRSDERESTYIGPGCDLVDGIVGYGGRISGGVRAAAFVTGTNVTVLYGARLTHVFLGDNSTVAGCEVMNVLIFPGHEQHHSNSFLCAAVLLGQSNIAAGVTAGSNHNSRANDGEIVAGRGFWPGLCVSLKHNSRFASFTLLAKADYPAELDIPLPFSLVSNDEHNGALLVMPAYWFMYNMYALARHGAKYAARDKRVHREQMSEFAPLAPDTVEEIFAALALLEVWTAKAARRAAGLPVADVGEVELRDEGRRLLTERPQQAERLEILGENIENSSRPVRILKAPVAYALYRDMVHHYAVSTLVTYLEANRLGHLAALPAHLSPPQRGAWVNAGGQLLLRDDLDTLRRRITTGELDTWEAVHAEYRRLWERYPQDKARHALASLLDINGVGLDELDDSRWCAYLDRALSTARWIADQVRQSRSKDYTNRFRGLVYDGPGEMEAVLGRLEENEFLRRTNAELESFARQVQRLKERASGA